MDDPLLLTVIIVAAVVLLAAAVVAVVVAGRKRKRTKELRERFGPEYDRAVEEHGGRRDAEARLTERQERREQLDIRPLDRAESEHYAQAWRQTQAKFVDTPGEAIGEADMLVAEVMRRRGYPMDDFEQRSEDISVDHPGVVDNYRSAHGISRAHEQGRAGTEDLRQAMVHYRSLFEELLDGREVTGGGPGSSGGHDAGTDDRDRPQGREPARGQERR